MPIDDSDMSVEVQYYLVPPGSGTDKIFRAYLDAVQKYERDAAKFVREIGAASAIQEVDYFGRHVVAAAFNPSSKIPSGWARESFGAYEPVAKKAFDQVSGLGIDKFRYPGIPAATRFGKLGNEIIAAYPLHADYRDPNRIINVTHGLPRFPPPSSIGEARPISAEEVKKYMKAAPAADRARFDLDHMSWNPTKGAKAFKLSKVVENDMDRYFANRFR